MDIDATMDRFRKQTDLHLILGLAITDLVLTIYGLSAASGIEINPFYRPFTGSIEMMAGGGILYLAILVAAGFVVDGDLRAFLGSVVTGMHVGGVSSWAAMIVSLPANWWYYTLLATAGTALFYMIFYD